MTQPIDSSITLEEDKASEEYESKTNRLIKDIIAQVRSAIADILVAENDLSDEELKTRIIAIVSQLKPAISKAAITTAVVEGLQLGVIQAGLDEDMREPKPTAKDAKAITADALDYVKVIASQARETIKLAKKLSMGPDYVSTIIGSAKQVETKAVRMAATIANRAQAEGTILAAKENNTKLVWVNEKKACLHCLAYAGRVVSPDKPFGNRSYDPKGLNIEALQLENPDGVKGPPLHPHCRCRLRVWDGPDPRNPSDIPTKNNNLTFPEALQREARRAVLRGDSDYDSLPIRIKAADKLLAIGANLPKTVEKRAARAIQSGDFSESGN